MQPPYDPYDPHKADAEFREMVREQERNEHERKNAPKLGGMPERKEMIVEKLVGETWTPLLLASEKAVKSFMRGVSKRGATHLYRTRLVEEGEPISNEDLELEALEGKNQPESRTGQAAPNEERTECEEGHEQRDQRDQREQDKKPRSKPTRRGLLLTRRNPRPE